MNSLFCGQSGQAEAQIVTGFTIGDLYRITYSAAQRPGYTPNGIQVSLDGIDLGTFTPSGTGFVLVTTNSTTATSGSMNLAFSGTFTTGDHDSAIDVVTIEDLTSIAGVPEPSTMALGGIALSALGLLRRKRASDR